MNTPHRRRLSVPLVPGDNARPDTAEKIEIILFYKDEKLKSHAVKHLTNMGESETTWKGLSSDERAVITRTIGQLQDLGCPHFLIPTTVPPCEYGVSSCRHYPRCAEVTAELEEIYLRAVSQVIFESVQKPRWASFFSDRDGNASLVFMPDRPVVAKASLLEENVYNLLTCYGAVGQSFQEMRDLQMEMIRNEARGRSINLHDENTWGLMDDDPTDDEEQEAHEIDAAGKIARKKSRAGRFRGGGAHWRRFLDEHE